MAAKAFQGNITMHITVSKTGDIRSVLVTDDIPPERYMEGADQVVRGSRGPLRIWTVIHGGVLPLDEIQELWRVYTDDPRRWVNVDLAPLAMDPYTFETFRREHGRKRGP